MTDYRMLGESILAEQQAVWQRIDPEAIEALVALIGKASRVYLLGEGRSGLAGRMFAMRLMHLGREAAVVGETVTPAIQDGDLLIACSASGETGVTCLLAEAAQTAGADVAAVTASPTSRLGSLADLRIVLLTPSKRGASGVPSRQYGGSLFEQSLILLFDTIVLAMTGDAANPSSIEALDARHANLE